MLKIFRKWWLKFFQKRFKFEDCLQQPLPFPEPLNCYILTNLRGRPEAAKKLCLTCKYWFTEKPILFIDCLSFHYSVSKDVNLRSNKTLMPMTEVSRSVPPLKIWLTGEATIIQVKWAEDAPPGIVKSVITKIDNCCLTKLVIISIDFTYDDYKFLTSNGKIKHLVISKVNLTHGDGSPVLVEDLLPFVPICTDLTL